MFILNKYEKRIKEKLIFKAQGEFMSRINNLEKKLRNIDPDTDEYKKINDDINYATSVMYGLLEIMGMVRRDDI